MVRMIGYNMGLRDWITLGMEESALIDKRERTHLVLSREVCRMEEEEEDVVGDSSSSELCRI